MPRQAPRPLRNATAALVAAERAYGQAVAPLGDAVVSTTSALVLRRLPAIVGDPASPRPGWRDRLRAELASAVERTWRTYTPRRAAAAVAEQRQRVDRLNLADLTLKTRGATASTSARRRISTDLARADLRDISSRWEDEQVGMLSGSVIQHVERVGKIIIAGVIVARALEDLIDDASQVDGMTSRGFVNATANATQTLNGGYSEARWEEAGVRRYRWITVGDDRVRPEHAERHGLIYAWDDPPEDGHPGEPYMCRCEAEPMIESPRETSERPTIGQLAEGETREREREGASRVALARFRETEVPTLERLLGERIENLRPRL